MSDSSPLGRLVVAWGPGVSHDGEQPLHPGGLPGDRPAPVDVLPSFHAQAFRHSPDPFASRCFGAAVQLLLAGGTVVVTDRVFEDAGRRDAVERSFRRLWPDLVVEHVRVAIPSDPATAGILVDDDVYGEGDWSSNETIAVESDAPPEAVVEALTRAAARMMAVGEDGEEYDAEGLEAVYGEVYTPNYVSDVEPDVHGRPGFYIDCKGGIEPPMAERFRAILVEELLRSGVTSARVLVPDNP